MSDIQIFGSLSTHRDQAQECPEHRGAWASFMHECVPCLRYGYAFQFNQRCGLLDLCAVLRKMGPRFDEALDRAATILDNYRKEHR
jgi:hypothetical protein